MAGFYTSGGTAPTVANGTLPLPATALIPVDVPLAGGAAPQSVVVTLAQLMGLGAPVALTDATSIATDASLGQSFSVTLGGNRTLATPTNLSAGRSYRWIITQDGTGSRTLAYGSAFKFSGSSTLTTTAAAVDIITAYYDGTTLWAVLSKAYA